MDSVLRQYLPEWSINAFILIGLLVTFAIIYKVHNAFYVTFFRGAKNLKKYGEWAIVTGCTDGIGKAIAEELAKKGMNLVLISRTQSKLNEQAGNIETKFKVKTIAVAVDFSSSLPNYLDPVKAAIKDLDVGILVNNVGMAYDHAEYFHLVDKEKIQQIIHMNVSGTTLMTYMVIPGMVERKRGAIINVSSASSLVSEPLYAVYTGTKAFINNFSEALHYEYKKYNIHVQAQLPGLVTSKLSKVSRASFFIPSPVAYAKSFISNIGYEPINITYWTHALQFGVALSLPRAFLSNTLLNRGLDIRNRAYKKKAAANKDQ